MADLQIFTCEQGSPEWFACRLGIPTASKFATVMAKGEGKTRRDYMFKLAGEKLTGEPMDSYSNGDMERGKLWEAEARERYAFEREVEPKQIGFMRRGDMGCSPDSLIDADGGLEIKTKAAHLQIETLLRPDIPPEHRAQLQGFLLVSGRDWIDFGSYCRKLPLAIRRATPDRDYIANMSGEIDRFNDELAELVRKVERYGAPAEAVAA